MRTLCLILITVLVSNAQAKEVRTHRSDGTVFPALKQEQRKQTAKRVKIAASVQALPAKDAWRDGTEPLSGGVRVAPAGEVEQSNLPILIEARPPRQEQQRKRPHN